MKKLIKFKRLFSFILAIISVAFLQSCAVNQYSQQQVTVPDIVQMSKDGLSSRDIIREIRHTHSVYGLKADQLAKLRDEGVQDSVINYMEQTRMNAVRQNQWMYDSYYGPGWYGGFGYYGGFGFGWPYYGWNWGPTIIISGHRNFGGFHGGGGFHGRR